MFWRFRRPGDHVHLLYNLIIELLNLHQQKKPGLQRILRQTKKKQHDRITGQKQLTVQKDKY